MKKLALITAMFAASVAQADVSYNAAATSDYVWRGNTQANHGAAVSGGVDYEHSSGLAAGVWVSNAAYSAGVTEVADDANTAGIDETVASVAATGGVETDYYASYSIETGALSLNAGVIHYDYISKGDFTEAFIGASIAGVDVTYSNTIAAYDKGDYKFESGDSYVSLGYGLDLSEDTSLSFGAGRVISDDEDLEKTDMIASLTKSMPEFDFTLSYTKKEDAESGFQVGVSKGF